MSKTMKLAADFNRYFTSSNGIDVPERVSVSRDEWRQLHAALQAERPDASPWTENVAVKLAPSRTGRAYIAGPMTGIAEFNFPAFNKEAVRLRAEGLTVLNPADHGIVEGAEWADYLRHDIAGLATCERIHLLPGWEKSKGARLEITIAQALGMAITLADGAASPAALDQGAPVPFLLNGTRFKMSFQTDLDAGLDPITTLTCFNSFQNQLDGRWVALVDAEDDAHLKLRTPQPAQATQAEVTDAAIDAATRHIYHNGRPTSKEYRVGIARAILALRPERAQMTGEQWTDVLGSAGPDLLDLAKQWSDNKVHVYQVVNEAEKIVKAAVLRGITAQAKKETP